MKNFSLTKAFGIGIAALSNSAKRFPVSIGFTLALTVYALTLIWGEEDRFTPRQEMSTLYYLAMGGVLALSLQLWGEEIKRKWIAIVANLMAHAALIADAIYLCHLPEGGFNMEIALEHASVIVALALSVCFGSFFRRKDDIPAWNFTLQLAGNAAIALLVGLIMWGGSTLLLASLSALFRLEIDYRCFDTLPLLCLQLLPTLLFLGLIPAGERKHDHTPASSDFLNKVIRYLILPLLGCYLVVLYAYAARILIAWQLPDGWVSMLVTALMAGCIGVGIGLYPSLRRRATTSSSQRNNASEEVINNNDVIEAFDIKEASIQEGASDKKKEETTVVENETSGGETGNSFNTLVVRWLPLLILPLLCLMSVGIFRRIADYGITLNRLYLLTLNGWFYLVCIGLFLGKARRIHWIPLSFGTLFVLTSALPVNYASCTRRYLYNKVKEEVVTTYRGTLPMSEEQYLDWLASIPREKALSVNSRIEHLDDAFNDPITQELFQRTPRFWKAERYIRSTHPEDPASDKGKEAVTVDSWDMEEVVIDKNYFIRFKGKQTWKLSGICSTTVAYAEESVKCFRQEGGIVLVLPIDGEHTAQVRIGLDKLNQWEALSHPLPPQKLPCISPDHLFILTAIEVKTDMHASETEEHFATVSGYLLRRGETKK